MINQALALRKSKTLASKTKKKKDSSHAAYFYPKLKQRQRILHTIKALIRITKLLMFSSAIYGIYLLWSMPFWQIANVELAGLSNIGHSYISKFYLEKNYLGQNILMVNPGKLNDELQNIRLFKEIKTYRRLFPTTLHLSFVERIPYMFIHDDKTAKDIIIDEEGVVLTFAKNFQENTNTIYSINKIFDFQITPEQVNVIRVIEHFRKNRQIADLGVFNITNPDNLILQTEKNKILLGNLDEFIMKIKSIPVIESLSKTSKNELEYIDVRYWKNPVLKLKKGSGSYEKSKKEFPN